VKKINLILVSVITLLSVVNISCKNLLQGSELKDQIDREIWLSKQEPLEIEEYSPSNQSNSYYKNSNITISFTKSMNTQMAEEGILIGSAEGQDDYKANYNAPIWENENHQIKFVANEFNLIPVQKGLTTNVYVTIPVNIEDDIGVPLKKTKVFHFTINSEVDNTDPVIESIKIAQGKNKLTDEAAFIEGELNDSNFETLLIKNIINETAVIYCEGHDYGGGKIFANLSYQQIKDANGNKYETELIKERISLSDFNEESKNYSKYIDLNFAETSEIKYVDGLIKVSVNLEDENGNLSKSTYDYYIIRDTTIEVSGEAYVYQSLPEFRLNPDGSKIEDWYVIPSINGITDKETFINKAEEQFKSDIYYVYKSDNVTKQMLTNHNDFVYTVSYGLGFNNYEVYDEPLTVHEWGEYKFSEQFLEYQNGNKDKNVFVRINYYDRAGNCSYKDGCIPAMPGVMNYTYDSTNQTVNLNIIDKSSINLPDYLGMKGNRGELSYKIFYGKKDGVTPVEDIVMNRNRYFSKDDEYDSLSDPFAIKIDPNSEYVVCVLTQYKFYSYQDWKWCGTWYSPLFVIDNVSAKAAQNYSISKPDFTFSKKSNGINSCSFTIDINYSSKESGVVYYPAWSTDGVNYSYYEANSTSITVPSSVIPPTRTEFYNDYVSKAGGKDWINSKDYTPSQTYTYKAYLKVIGVKGTSMVSSDVKEVIFTNNDDNTPPQMGTWSKEHDLYLEEYSKVIKSRISTISDNEWNLKNEFTYYWTEYKDSWGYNTNFYSEEQIAALQNSGTGYFDSYYGINKYDDPGLMCNTNFLCIPIDQIEDGDYMFFAKIEDKCGNYKYVTLGKVQLKHFANELKVSYDKTSDKISVSLDLEPNERFEKNTVTCQFTYYDDNTHEYGWACYNNNNTKEEREHIRRNASVSNNKITYTTETKSYYDVDSVWYPHERFVKTYIYSYNENEITGYDPETDSFKETVPNYVYDAYDTQTEETLSTVKVIYVGNPASTDDEYVCNKKYFASSAGYNPILMCDKPVLVEYIKSSKDLGNNLDEWERRGTVINSAVYNDNDPGRDKSSPNYLSCTDLLQLDASVINKENGSFYYVVAVHFVDGTSDMSVVYRK